MQIRVFGSSMTLCIHVFMSCSGILGWFPWVSGSLRRFDNVKV
jgi:hypothetical protein